MASADTVTIYTDIGWWGADHCHHCTGTMGNIFTVGLNEALYVSGDDSAGKGGAEIMQIVEVVVLVRFPGILVSWCTAADAK